jgi:hypothetical protein
MLTSEQMNHLLLFHPTPNQLTNLDVRAALTRSAREFDLAVGTAASQLGGTGSYVSC